MALPFLPAEHIQPAFVQLTDGLSDDVDDRVADLVNYIESTWIDSRLWPPSAWSAYRSSVRTNNDVEGWHNRLNQRCRHGNLDLYQLAPLLYAEAQFVTVQAVLVSERRLLRYQRRATRKLQGRIATYWDQYAAGVLTTSSLLKKCAYVYGPVN